MNLPHDWAIKGPFYEGWDAEVGGGMGRLPSPGVAWYRKKLDIPLSDAGKSLFLDVEGAMSYAMVWLNGHLVGGWPYGYASWRVDCSCVIPEKKINWQSVWIIHRILPAGIPVEEFIAMFGWLKRMRFM